MTSFFTILAVAAPLFAATTSSAPRPGQSGVCELPAGFVNPPRPEVAPLEQLLSHTERVAVARPIKAAAQSGNRPLHEAIRPTKDLPGVSGTLRLSDGPYGTVGARRLVCLTDGSIRSQLENGRAHAEASH
jgi:hypothetical protein